MIACFQIQEFGPGPCKQRCTLVDLVEGIGHGHRRAGLGWIDHRLGKGKQRLAAAIDGDDLCLRVQVAQLVPSCKPVGDAPPQFGGTCRGRIARQACEVVPPGLQDQQWRGVLGLADGQAHRLVLRAGRDPFEQRIELLKGVGLQKCEVWVHGVARTRSFVWR